MDRSGRDERGELLPTIMHDEVLSASHDGGFFKKDTQEARDNHKCKKGLKETLEKGKLKITELQVRLFQTSF